MECHTEEDGLSRTAQTDACMAWKDFFGSSVSLAPSLMSIYDKAADVVASSCECDCYYVCRRPASSQPQQQANHRLAPQYVVDHIDLGDPPETATTASSCQSYCLPSSACRASPPSGSGAPLTDNIAQCCSPITSRPTSNSCNRSSDVDKSSSGGVNLNARRRRDSANNSGKVIHKWFTTSSSASNSDSRLSSAAAMTDLKKRPLSIRSNSSSASSTSIVALRNRRKKLATDAGSEANIEAWPATVDGDLSTVDELHSTLSEQHRNGMVHQGSETTMMTDDDEDDYDDPEQDAHSTSENSAGGSTTKDRKLSEPCDVDSKLEQAASWRCYAERVITELIDTERAYVTDLNDVIQGYLGCCISNVNNNLSLEDVCTLFGNIKTIYQFNSDFLASLDMCQLDSVRVANCFQDHSQGFAVYSDYCTNYPRSLAVLDKLMQDPLAANLLWHQQVILQHELPIGSYLLKPVQRLFKYQLLLQSLLSHCVQDEAASEAVAAALKSMVGVARSINEWKREHERAVRVAEMQGLLDANTTGTDLALLGELLLEDKFKLSGAKTYRHLFLFQKGLLIAKRKEDGNFQMKASITCNNLMLVETVQKAPLSFNLIPFNNPRMQFTVQARTMEQKRQWCCQIKKLILDSYESVIPDRTKQLVLTLVHSQDQANDTSIDEHSSSSVSQFADRRKVHRKSTGFIADLATLKSAKCAKGLQRSESVNSSFRSFELSTNGCQATQTESDASSTSHSNQSLHSQRGVQWQSSWSSHHDTQQPATPSPCYGVAPTAIAENISDDDSPNKEMEYQRCVADIDVNGQTSFTSQCFKTPDNPTLAQDAAAIVRSKADSTTNTRPLRSASVDRRLMHHMAVADADVGMSGTARCPLSGSQSVRLRDAGLKPFVRQKTSIGCSLDGWQKTTKKHAFGVANHVGTSSNELDCSNEQLNQRCSVAGSAGLPPVTGLNGLHRKSTMTHDATGSVSSVSKRSSPPKAVVESDLDEEVVGAERPSSTITEDVGRRRHQMPLLRTTQSQENDDVKGPLSSGNKHETFRRDSESSCGRVRDDSQVLLKSLYFEQQRRTANSSAPRAKRSGSYHGLAHHSVTASTDVKTSRHSVMTNNGRSTVDSLKSALTSFAEKLSGRWSSPNGGGTAAPTSSAPAERSRFGRAMKSANDSSENAVASFERPVVAVGGRSGLVSRLIARASGRFPKRRSKSGDRSDAGIVGSSHWDKTVCSTAEYPPPVIATERRRDDVGPRSWSPADGPRRSTAPSTSRCSRSKSVDLCETTDLADLDENCSDDEDRVMCRLICGGPSWSDGIDQAVQQNLIRKNEASSANSGRQVPFIDDSEAEE